MEINGQLRVTSWQEDEIRTLAGEGGKLTRASIGSHLAGDIDGEAVDDVVMYYRADSTTCTGCHHSWYTVHGSSPYQPNS